MGTPLKRVGSEKGQSAAEAVFSIPIMLVLFLIGFQLFGIAWNAQYAHVSARYQMLNKNYHKGTFTACYVANGGGNGVSTTDTGSEQVQAPFSSDPNLLGPQAGSGGGSGSRNISQNAQMTCNTP
jgi:hypothetical protein